MGKWESTVNWNTEDLSSLGIWGGGERGRDVRRRRREPRARTPRAPSTHDSSELKAGYSERDPEAEE